jgi:hypothetical protein
VIPGVFVFIKIYKLKNPRLTFDEKPNAEISLKSRLLGNIPRIGKLNHTIWEESQLLLTFLSIILNTN